MTYATLKADIAAWEARTGTSPADVEFQAEIPSFIALAEDAHRFGLKRGGIEIAPQIWVSDMERRAQALGNGTRYLPLPDNILEFERVWLVGNPVVPLTQTSTQSIAQYYNNATTTKRYCVRRGEMEFDYAVGDAVNIEMVYVEAYPRLASDTDTNWLLENCYSAYLFGALYYAEKWNRNDERAASWANDYASAVGGLVSADDQGDISSGQMIVTVARAIG